MPTMNIRRRPKRSPRAAPVRSSTANDSVYALTVHSSDSIEAPRLLRIDGSAVETTRLSRVVMNSAIETIARVQRARRLIACSLVCECLLMKSANKKGSSVLRVHAVVRQDVGPVSAGGSGIERGHHVHQHPGREEAPDLDAVAAGFALDEIDE